MNEETKKYVAMGLGGLGLAWIFWPKESHAATVTAKPKSVAQQIKDQTGFDSVMLNPALTKKGGFSPAVPAAVPAPFVTPTIPNLAETVKAAMALRDAVNAVPHRHGPLGGLTQTAVFQSLYNVTFPKQKIPETGAYDDKTRAAVSRLLGTQYTPPVVFTAPVPFNTLIETAEGLFTLTPTGQPDPRVLAFQVAWNHYAGSTSRPQIDENSYYDGQTEAALKAFRSWRNPEVVGHWAQIVPKNLFVSETVPDWTFKP